MIKEAIQTLVSGKSLTREEAAAVMEEVMEGKATPSQLGAFLTALRMKDETADEIAGLASVMRAKAIRVTVSEPVLDIVGTGGDNAGTFNISTAAALVAAGAGAKVAKHGNRAASSQCGSADVLETLGVKIDLPAEGVQRCIEEAGIGFMFAPAFHPAMKHAAPTRREIGIRTVFNILGPLTNPAHAEYMVIGVPGKELQDKIALALPHMGVEHALVVHGEDGLDEITITGETAISEIKGGEISRYSITPEDFGLSRAGSSALKGGTAAENAAILRSVLGGAPGPRRDVVLLNAAAGLVAGNLATTLRQGVALAKEVIDSGRAMLKLEKLIKVSQRT
ncbi:MAG: anthranilate phosphoribosyltransferase [Kiritimatiellota bacterium]|nr:anthranilate phosphoribosyltransferase [Kiritimatiellota bacterium]